LGLKLADLATQRATDTLVGREQEQAMLRKLLDERGPLIVWVHGIAGIGKTLLLEAFLPQARASEATVLRLNSRGIEPTERGFLDALSAAIGGTGVGASDAAERLGQLGPRVVLAIDNYELLRLLDAWMRQVFVPALPNSVRIVLVGREAPFAAWRDSPGWSDLFVDLRLTTLADVEALELLARHDVPENQRASINRLARGHPLALAVAAAAIRSSSKMDF